MIDFTNCEINKFKYYAGKNGGKFCIKYNDADYMLKFPKFNEDINNLGYLNNCISEYVACNIIKTLVLEVQDTLLGLYDLKGSKKIVVACKDFTSEGTVLKQFAEIKNSRIDISKSGYETELLEVIKTIENQQIYDVKELKEFFWNMFIADALLGNFDRHNGNWGFLINESLKKIHIAPIYDCASCLYPSLTDEKIAGIINDYEEMKARVYVFPTSALKINGKKINYFEYISSLENEDCNKALNTIFSRINLKIINNIIDETPFILDIRKEFYKKIIKMRCEMILQYSYKKYR